MLLRNPDTIHLLTRIVNPDSIGIEYQTYGKNFEKTTTQLRRPLVPAKRIANVLHWLAQANSFSEVAALYAIGKSTGATIVHEGITILREWIVPEVILFPTGQELDRVMMDFEALCGLPCCGVALDGTFMAMKKPSDFGIHISASRSL